MIKIIGAGIYGCSLARLLADANYNVEIVDQRNVIGGNCYSYYDNGIEVHKYGSHIFHCTDDEVWNFVLRFTKFNCYQHHVIALHNGKTYCLPFNLMLINSFFNTNFTPNKAKEFIDSIKAKIDNPKNLEEQACTLVGNDLYQAFIKNYTAKQWNRPLTELSSEIIKRIPIRYNYNMSYFNDKYQGIPIDGYTKMLTNMICHKNIHVNLNTKYDISDLTNDEKDANIDAIVYTGPIDELCEYCFGTLPWRSLRFETKFLDENDFQGNATINYVDADVKFTRIHEFKHYHPEKQIDNCTIIQYEYPNDWNISLERYYPINDKSSAALYMKYTNRLNSYTKLHLGGRLGCYVYADMDDSIANAMKMFKHIENELKHTNEKHQNSSSIS